MKKRRLSPLGTLAVTSLMLLLVAGYMATWLGSLVLNPVRFTTLTATGSSVLATPRAFFRSSGYSTSVGTSVDVPILLESSAAARKELEAELSYNPADFLVTLNTAVTSICATYTLRDHDVVNGTFRIKCSAPTGSASGTPFAVFTVTPVRVGGLPLELKGRFNDYAVVTAR